MKRSVFPEQRPSSGSCTPSDRTLSCAQPAAHTVLGPGWEAARGTTALPHLGLVNMHVSPSSLLSPFSGAVSPTRCRERSHKHPSAGSSRANRGFVLCGRRLRLDVSAGVSRAHSLQFGKGCVALAQSPRSRDETRMSQGVAVSGEAGQNLLLIWGPGVFSSFSVYPPWSWLSFRNFVIHY